MFGIGGFELFLILIFGFLIFGPDKLPEIAKTIGKAIAKFRGAQETMNEKIKDVSFVDKESDDPIKNPLEVIEGAAASSKEKSKHIKEAAKEAAGQAKETAAVVGGVAAERAESFAERKARYDRERKARREAEAASREADKAAMAAKEADELAKRENPTTNVAHKSIEEEED